jgi:LPS export ABC transporter protein LptC
MIFINYRKAELGILPAPQTKKVDVSFKRIVLNNTEDGITSWRLEAEAADFDTRNRDGFLNEVKITFFNENEGDLVLTADEGELKEGGTRMEARGNVVVQGSQGYTLYTDKLEYFQEKDLISTESPVRFLADGLEVRGRGMRFHVRDRALKIIEKVNAYIAETVKTTKG